MRQVILAGMRLGFGHIARVRRSVPAPASRRVEEDKTLAFAICALLILAALAACATWLPPMRKDGRSRRRREEDERFTRSLAGLATAFLLLVLGLWLTERLADLSKLDDCLLRGRSNCERIELSPAR